MLLQGVFDPTHIIREFFAHEYAFSVQWPTDISVRIAHRKGVWYLAKLKKEKVADYFAVDDGWNYPNLLPAPQSLIRGFIEAKKEMLTGEEGRHEVAVVLTDLLNFWGGDLEKIKEINVLQPGRNASVSENGTFDLEPREDEWHK